MNCVLNRLVSSALNVRLNTALRPELAGHLMSVLKSALRTEFCCGLRGQLRPALRGGVCPELAAVLKGQLRSALNIVLRAEFTLGVTPLLITRIPT